MTAATSEASSISRDDQSGTSGLQSYSYDDGIVRMFMVVTFVWGLVAFLVGILLAIQLPFPAVNGGIEYITFGRLRPLHTNAAIFAFAGNAIFAAIYYSTQRLCKARMWSDTLSRLHFWGWQLIIVSAALTLPLGVTQGKEYAELEWPIDLAIAVVWAGFFGVNFFMTLVTRRERHMYVALWFYIATIVTVAILHIFNNIWVPLVATGTPGTMLGYLKSYPIYAGAQDAMMQWWYGHNAVAFFLTTPFLGLMYYFLPKAADRPVFSYRLSILHFWSLVFIYIWAGPHHLHYAPVPEWVSTLGMVFSIMLWMPSWGGMINGLLTLRGAWHKVTTDPVLKFYVVAITFYGMSTFEGPLLSIKAVNALSHYTDWTIGHVHAGALGWNGFMAYGMIYWLAPRLWQTKLHSQKLANMHFWLATIGILVYVISMYGAGIMQGLMWRGLDERGNLEYTFVQTTERIVVLYHVRLLGGLLYMAGALVGAYNLLRTYQSRPKQYEVVVHEALPLSQKPVTPDVKPKTSLDGVAGFGQALDVWWTFWWHRAWERMPIKFTLMTILAVASASLMIQVPSFVIRSNAVMENPIQRPYTPLELAGRDIYVSEGCYNCHSQMVRPMVSEKQRYGDYSLESEYIYDHPFQWSSRRIGPDLFRSHQKQNLSAEWHVRHFRDPQANNPASIMPPYPFLITKKLDFDSIPARVGAMMVLHPNAYPQYADDQLDQAKLDAQEQANRIAKLYLQQLTESEGNEGPPPTEENDGISDKQVVALIAYLQRVGTDRYTDPEAEPAETPEETTADDEGENPNPAVPVALSTAGDEGGRER